MDIIKSADLSAVARTWGEVQKDLATHAPNFYMAYVILNEIYTGRIVNCFPSIKLDLKVHPIQSNFSLNLNGTKLEPQNPSNNFQIYSK